MVSVETTTLPAAGAPAPSAPPPPRRRRRPRAPGAGVPARPADPVHDPGDGRRAGVALPVLATTRPGHGPGQAVRDRHQLLLLRDALAVHRQPADLDPCRVQHADPVQLA